MHINQPFRIVVSKKADKVDFELLPQEVQKAIQGDIRFDPVVYDIYRFFIVVEFVTRKNGRRIRKKYRHRNGFDKADKILVKVRVPENSGIRIIGAYPVSRCAQEKKAEVEAETEAEVSGRMVVPLVPGLFVPGAKLKIIGRVKDFLRKRRCFVLSGFTDWMAEWLFLPPLGVHYEMILFCEVPKDLKGVSRQVYCGVSVQDKGREIEGFKKRRVTFPA